MIRGAALPGGISQMLMAPLWTSWTSGSPPQVTRCLPSRLKEANSTGSGCLNGPATSLPVLAFQTRAARSPPTVTTRLPSELNAA